MSIDATTGGQLLEVAEVLVPFKYDLGGSLKDAKVLKDRLLATFGNAAIDSSAARSFNISYLATHPPILHVNFPPASAKLGINEWHISRQLLVYPWLGILSVDMLFHDAEPPLKMDDIVGFYDELIRAKNEDYFSYLDTQGCMTEALGAHIGAVMSHEEPRLSIAPIVNATRAAAVDLLSLRPGRYDFHDLRMFFLVKGDPAAPASTAHSLIGALLDLSSTDIAREKREPRLPEALLAPDLKVWSSGWSTVAMSPHHTSPSFMGGDRRSSLDTARMLFGLVHAQWFVCQVWISTYGIELRAKTDGEAGPDLGAISHGRYLLSRDLTEVANLDVMLKDPALIRAALYFHEAFGTTRHRTAAEHRLMLLSNRYEELLGMQQTRDARRLQLLFAFSAAAGIAALVPALAVLNSQIYLMLLTAGLALGVWALFMFNFAALFTKIRNSKQSAPDERSNLE